jgi:hypothetical protein
MGDREVPFCDLTALGPCLSLTVAARSDSMHEPPGRHDARLILAMASHAVTLRRSWQRPARQL